MARCYPRFVYYFPFRYEALFFALKVQHNLALGLSAMRIFYDRIVQLLTLNSPFLKEIEVFLIKK